jgi:hypothetical protein
MAMQHSDITQSIIGYAMRVHSPLGNGFQEAFIYFYPVYK